MVKFKLDLHTHTSDFSTILFMRPNKKQYLIKLLNNLYKKGDNLIVGLADYNDDGRYSKFIKVIKELPKEYTINTINKEYMVSIKKGNKIIYFIKADEIETDKGHILIIGNKENVRVRNFKNVLKKARKRKWLVIADHPLHEANFSYFLISKIIREDSKLSLVKKDILKNKKYFNALELNSYFSEDRNKIKRFGKKSKIPIIANSDAHFINEFFNSYFEMENLNLKNISTFKKSFKKELKKHIKNHVGKHGLTAKYKHGIQILFEKIGKNIGIVK